MGPDVDPGAEQARASAVVAACEAAWREIQRQHPEVPDAVIVLGSGVQRGRLVKLGHWWAGRWEADGESRGEVLLAGEALHLPPGDVFEVLLHEAAHGLNAARKVKDTSRGGRYHNARYRQAAIEVGLQVEQSPPYGWAKTTLSTAATERYASEIGALGEAARIARRLETPTAQGRRRDGADQESGDGSTRRSQGRSLVCGCGRRIRMAPTVAAQGPVVCGVCGSAFRDPHEASRTAPESNVVPIRSGLSSSTPGRAAGNGLRSTPPEEAQTTGSGLMLTRVATWARRGGEGVDEALIAGDDAEAARLNRLARRFRTIAGEVSGPEIAAGSMTLAAGDRVIVRREPARPDLWLPEVGVLGDVTSVDRLRRTVTVDFPIAGRTEIGAADAGRHLGYGYAITAAQAAMPPHPGRGVDRAHRRAEALAEVIELDLP